MEERKEFNRVQGSGRHWRNEFSHINGDIKWGTGARREEISGWEEREKDGESFKQGCGFYQRRRNLVHSFLKDFILDMPLRASGKRFHSLAPAIVNDLSYTTDLWTGRDRRRVLQDRVFLLWSVESRVKRFRR